MRNRLPDSAVDRSFDGARFMIVNYLLGAGVGVVFAVAILATDMGHLRTLMVGDSSPWLAMTLLTAAMAFTFSGLYAGVSIMLTFRGKPGEHTPPDADQDLLD